MRAAAILALLLFCSASPAFAEGPAPLADRSVPAAPAKEYKGPESQGAPPGTYRPGNELPPEYYTQKVEAIEGVVTAVDTDNKTVTIMSGDAEAIYAYDGLSVFQVKLDPITPDKLKTGSKIAGLYREKDGSLYISRVVVITGEHYRKKSRRHHHRTHRKRRRR